MSVRTITVSLAGALAVTLTGTPAHATDLSYDYLELRFVDTEIGSQDGDGLRLAGSYQVSGNWLLVGGYTSLDFDGGVDADTLEIGAGYVYRYKPEFDLVGYAKLVRTEVEAGGFDNDETGFSLAGGIRGRFTPELEGRATVNYIDVDDSDTFFEFGGDYHFTEQFSAGVTLEVGGDADTFTIGARWFFGE
ncbi:MAG: hypothetical protein AAFX56_08180 [Pseudomonadota bacterium]